MIRIIIILILWLINLSVQAQQGYTIRSHGKWGAIDADGKVLIAANYEYIGAFNEQRLAIFKTNGKYGLLEEGGKEIIPAKYEDLRLTSQYILVAQAGKWGALGLDGSILLPAKYERLSTLTSSYIKVWKNRFAGVVDLLGNEVLPIEYHEVEALENGIFAVWNEAGKIACLNAQGKQILPYSYEAAQSANGYLLLKTPQGWGIADTLGNMLLPASYGGISPATDILEGSFKVTSSFSQKHGLFSTSHNRLLFDTLYVSIQPLAGSLWITRENALQERFTLHKEGRGKLVGAIEEYKLLADDRVVAIKPIGKNKWGLFSLLTNQWVLPPKYDEIRPKFGNFVEAVSIGKNLLIDIEGRPFGDRAYDEYIQLREGLWGVSVGEEWGMMDNDGKLILEPSVGQLYSFQEEFAISIYRKGEKYGLINQQGELLTSALYALEEVELYPVTNKGKLTHNNENVLLTFNQEGKITDKIVSSNLVSFHIRKQGVVENSQRFVPASLENMTAVEEDGLADDDAIVNRAVNPIVTRYQRATLNYRWYLGDNARREVWKPSERKIIERYPERRIKTMPRPLDIDSASVIRIMVANYGKRQLRYAFMKPNGVTVYRLPMYNVYKRRKMPELIGFIGAFYEGLARVNIGGYVHDRDISGGFLPFKYLSVRYFNDHRCSGGKWGYINSRGEMAVEATYSHAKDFKHGRAIVKKQQKWGVIDREGNVVIDFLYDSIARTGPQEDLFLLINIGKKYGYIDTLGHEVLPTQYDEVAPYQKGLIAAREGELWGFANSEGQWNIEPQYLDAKNFSEQLAAVRDSSNYRWGYINLAKQWVLKSEYREAKSFKGGKAPARPNKGGYIIIDTKGNKKQEGKKVYGRMESPMANRFIVKPYGKRYGVMDEYGKWLIKPKYDQIALTDDSLYFKLRKRRYLGLATVNTGKQVLPCRYTDIASPAEGLMAVARYKKFQGNYGVHYGYVDLEGKSVIPMRYTSAGDFKEGVAMVEGHTTEINPEARSYQKDTRYINASGEVLMQGYAAGLGFSEGKALVFNSRTAFNELSEPMIMNKEGKVVFETVYNPKSTFQQGRMRVDWVQSFFIDSLGYKIESEGSPQEAYNHSVAWSKFKMEHNRASISLKEVQSSNSWRQPVTQNVGLTDLAGLTVSAIYYHNYGPWVNGVARVEVNQLMGLADSQGQMITPVYYPRIVYLGEGLFSLERKGDIGYFNAVTRRWVWALK